MNLRARTRGGDRLWLVGFDGKHFQLLSERPFAPGQPLNLAVELGDGLTLELKSLGSVRRSDGTFLVRARAQTLSRGARDALSALS
jgi:hypothetical protein